MALIRKMPISPSVNFMRHKPLLMLLSAAIVTISILLFFVQGLNFGVDFRGGILIEVQTRESANIGELRARLNGLGLGDVTLQTFGEPHDILINVEQPPGDEEQQIQAIDTVKEALGDTVIEYRRTEFVGPTVGKELQRAGAIATVLALLGIAVYVWFRFEWQFALSGLVALAHDVIGTVGFYALTQIEFNLATLAAVLMIAGYSINDTVVIFDRVREMLRKFKKLGIDDILNVALNRTLSRTILTSFTTLLALIALAVFGGEVIRGFTLGLIWGIVIGTFSTVALATPLLAYLNVRAAPVEEEEGKRQQKAST